jgi:hypothetical protein
MMLTQEQIDELKNSQRPEVQKGLADLRQQLEAEDEARLDEFKSPLRPMVELSRAAIPKLQHYVGVLQVILNTPLPATLKDSVRPFHRRATQCVKELANVVDLYESLSLKDSYEARKASKEFILARVSGVTELVNSIESVLTGLSVSIAPGITVTVTIQEVK